MSARSTPARRFRRPGVGAASVGVIGTGVADTINGVGGGGGNICAADGGIAAGCCGN